MPEVEFNQSMKSIADSTPGFARELLEDAVSCMLNGAPDDGRILLKNYVRATMGFPELAHRTGKNDKNLMRSLSERGNPTASNLFEIIQACLAHEGVSVTVSLEYPF